MSRTHWHRAARTLRVHLRETQDAESALSSEVLQEGKAHRHWKCVAEDACERVAELEEELARARADFDRLSAGLVQAAESFGAASRAMLAAIPADLTDQFARDYVPHINLMAGLGDPDYLKANGMSIRHTDLRAPKPRAKKPQQQTAR